MPVRAGFAGRSDRFVLKLALVMIDCVAVLVFVLMLVAMSVTSCFGGVNRFFVRGFGFDVRAFHRAQRVNFFDGLGFVDALVGDFDFIDGANLLAFFFVLFLFVVFIECCATNDGVCRSVRLNFVLLGFDDAGSESGNFVLAQRSFGSAFFLRLGVFEFVSFFTIWRRGDRTLER